MLEVNDEVDMEDFGDDEDAFLQESSEKILEGLMTSTHAQFAQPRQKPCSVCGKEFASEWKRSRTCQSCLVASTASISPSKKRKLFPMILSQKKVTGHGSGGEASFSCDICSRSFKRQPDMIKHVTHSHPKDMHRLDLLKFVGEKEEVRLTTATWES